MAVYPTYTEELEYKKRKKTERYNFIITAKKFGFTTKQAIFMYKYLAEKEHKHWNGLVG